MDYQKNKFELVSKFKPTGDQPVAINKLMNSIKNKEKYQVLLGATGTGKTFTMANIIEKVNKPTLILVHNKTLAGQLYSELKDLFPNNRVEYFVSNFDFYQPEAYIASSDLHIDKNAVSNSEIEMMRTSAINSCMHRSDTIVVGSVASIYGLSDPDEYFRLLFDVRVGEKLDKKVFINQLLDAQYKNNPMELNMGTFRIKGDVIDIMPAYINNSYIRIDTFDDVIESIKVTDLVTGEAKKNYKTYPIFPANDHATTKARIIEACDTILDEFHKRYKYFIDNKCFLEAERLEFRTKQDIDSMREFGFCPGIENYSAHIDKRKPGQKPFCLIDYFPKDFLLIVDESHITLPQIKGMYFGDRSRKESLVKYGFRLPSALDNRPLQFDEFMAMINQVIFSSATPGDLELELAKENIAQQIIRPTGLLDPIVEVRNTLGQIDDIINEIRIRKEKNERVMITTLTIKMAEDLTAYLKKQNLKVVYMHSECKTLERTQIIYEYRKGKYDVLVGINLLREGLDIPEVSLVCILDADKQGFLRSTKSLIQTIGRAARNESGKVIFYADTISDAMKQAMDETSRRREIQEAYNEENGIIPTTIEKEIAAPIRNSETIKDIFERKNKGFKSKKDFNIKILELRRQMKKYADEFEFEKAIEIRDIIIELEDLYKK